MFIPQDSRYDRYVISQSQFRVRCNDKVLPEYLVYYFHTPIGQHKLLSNASQVGVPALARPSSTFQQIEVVLPELSIQKRVVEIISTIQKKIVNRYLAVGRPKQAKALIGTVILPSLPQKMLAHHTHLSQKRLSQKKVFHIVTADYIL